MKENNLYNSIAKLLINENKNIRILGLAPKYYEVKNGVNKEFYLKKHKIDKKTVIDSL